MFVGREHELKQIGTWVSQGDCVGAVYGARQTGKTSLLHRFYADSKERYLCVIADLQLLDKPDPAECYSYVAGRIAARAPAVGHRGFKLPQDSSGFSEFLTQVSRRSRAVRIAVMLDELGSLPLETAVQLASTIRYTFSNRDVDKDFKRFFFLIAGSTDLLRLTSGDNSPLNVTDEIHLGDLSLRDTERLLEIGLGYKEDLQQAVAPRLHRWTGGHPYWTQLIASNIATHSDPPDDSALRRTVEGLLQTEEKNLAHLFHALDRGDGRLWDLTRSILDGAPVLFTRANPRICELELIGAIKQAGDCCAIRNEIYREALRRRFPRTARANPAEASASVPAPHQQVRRRIFIGHGHSPAWRILKDFLSERLKLSWDEFNREPPIGRSTTERLDQMMQHACFAFLVMTAEEERPDGAMRTRDNVIHEAGLFQGRLGFQKAIILMEEGCANFSNIEGLTCIRFPKNNIEAVFEQIRRVLEREGIAGANRSRRNKAGV
jgi:predicted nucleotide-binding protein